MAQYTYECENKECGVEFDVEHPIPQAPGADCPHCGKRTVRRLIERTSFALKGGGWYRDGY